MDKPNFSRWTIINFVEQLAEGTPMPGGGCAVAMVGALAAALGSLSGQISLKKETDQVQKEVWRELRSEIDRAREKFLELIDADALAYHGVVLARRLPHRNAEEKSDRTAAIIQAFARACETPKQMSVLGLEVLEWAIRLEKKGSPIVLADVGVMGFLAVAVTHGGIINILSNLTMMAASPQASEWRQEAAGLQQTLAERSREFEKLIYRQLGSEPAG